MGTFILIIVAGCVLTVTFAFGQLALSWASWDAYSTKPTYGGYLKSVIGRKTLLFIIGLWSIGFIVFPAAIAVVFN